jgi:hypothetical protein
MKISKLLFCILFSTISAAEYLCFDKNFSSYAGAENILFLQKGFEKIEDFVFPVPKITPKDFQYPSDCPHFSMKSAVARASRNLLIGIPLHWSSYATQHEIFGFGYRIRDLGSKYAKVTSYKINMLSGNTTYTITNQLTPSQHIAITVAGFEADAILSNRIKLKWLADKAFDPRQTFIYLLSSLEIVDSSWQNTSSTRNALSSKNSEISNFLFYLNAVYRNKRLSHAKLRNISLLNLIDPFIFYSIYAHNCYIRYGLPLPVRLIKIGQIEYMPSVRVGLTPFGLQGYIDNFFLTPSNPMYAYLKWGRNGSNTYYGFGIENQHIWNWKNFSFGLRLDAWRQPRVLFQQGTLSAEQIATLSDTSSLPPLYPASVLNKRSLGAAFFAVGTYVRNQARLFTELGYKSNGYLPGEALRQSPIIRGGISGQF